MDKTEFINAIKSVAEIEDQTERNNAIADIIEKTEDVYGKFEQIENENKDLTETNKNVIDSNEELRKANMRLFRQLGTDKSSDDVKSDETGIEKEKAPRRYEDLFNDKGELF